MLAQIQSPTEPKLIITRFKLQKKRKKAEKQRKYSSFVDKENGFGADTQIGILAPDNPPNPVHGKLVHLRVVFLLSSGLSFAVPFTGFRAAFRDLGLIVLGLGARRWYRTATTAVAGGLAGLLILSLAIAIVALANARFLL